MSFDPIKAKAEFFVTNDFEEAQLALNDALISIDATPCQYMGNDEEQYQQWEMYIQDCRADVLAFGIKAEVIA